MARRGLTDEEIALAKGMIALGMKRDVIHSFFVSPGNPLTPAFVAEISAGLLGAKVELASKDQTLAFIFSRTAYSDRVTRRSQQQLPLFPEPPDNIISPHYFRFFEARLIRDEHFDYMARNRPHLVVLLKEAREEFSTLLVDPALGNHLRLKQRLQKTLDALPEDLAKLEPVLTGARAKKAVTVLAEAQAEFSAEFVGDITATMSSVFMLLSHYEEWQRFELRVNEASIRDQPDSIGRSYELGAIVSNLPHEYADSEVGRSLLEFFDQIGGRLQAGQSYEYISPEVHGALKAYINYAVLSTVNQFAATLVRELESDKVEKRVGLGAAVKDGVDEGVKKASSVITSGAILFAVYSPLLLIATAHPEIMGWLRPYLERIKEMMLPGN